MYALSESPDLLLLRSLARKLFFDIVIDQRVQERDLLFVQRSELVLYGRWASSARQLRQRECEREAPKPTELHLLIELLLLLVLRIPRAGWFQLKAPRSSRRVILSLRATEHRCGPLQLQSRTHRVCAYLVLLQSLKERARVIVVILRRRWSLLAQSLVRRFPLCGSSLFRLFERLGRNEARGDTTRVGPCRWCV